MNPSRTTGTRRAAPTRITPTSPAISKPPTPARTSTPAPGTGAFTARARDRVGHAEVGDDDARPRLAREDVHRGSAPQEVFDHLRGHDLRIGADALGDHAVVGCEGEDHRSLDARRPVPQHGEARRDLL